MSQKIEVGTADVPGVGLVAYRVQVNRNAGGEVFMRVLQDARYVDGNRVVVDDDHRARIASHLRAV
ncbi:hypothetical protein IFU40_13590 [Microbacterium sp. CFBP 13617]|uniref:hypothetical protein n=1 Tax=Microbacterium sp. CFBP 13617 TaxID=2774035 RepID=UPI0017830982|nr:hypothetical protein [Microbacterium sp. CFBP 13617]MBD8219666.1 hypothetical protein [Microbacterium sp. CFBP 13617]